MRDLRALLSRLSEEGVRFILVGGLAAAAHGSARVTFDVDVVYDRSPKNLDRLVRALAPLHPYLRGAPPGLPFRFDAETLARGLNFTLTTTAGDIDLLGEVLGGGGYDELTGRSIVLALGEQEIRCVTLDALIDLKRAAGRPKDFEALAELEAIREERGE